MTSRTFTIKAPKVCQVCKHKDLIYIGKQQIDKDGKEFLALFNCNVCHSTISLRTREQKSGVFHRARKS